MSLRKRARHHIALTQGTVPFMNLCPRGKEATSKRHQMKGLPFSCNRTPDMSRINAVKTVFPCKIFFAQQSLL